ncbi:glycine zipper 2TM domain-containing protein [Caulobacter sp. RL271]|uniref:17 kDa surface antigen n=1 Tax=Caulobacter segnis TaxID=88688 RepID=A0ABY4ZVW0_9CAUL|nr:glycine zipper 2TM domain-containing protein [Caulobacter segnis]USQ96132.1 glycine zipper 2TM domain-containing protein [Caulobacter segnis]
MRIQTLVAGACAVALIPTIALAQQTCQQRQGSRVASTLAGGGIGAIAGSAVAGRGDRGTGAVIGGAVGALIGNQVAKGEPDCARAYGFYDSQGAWHAQAITRGEATGYFDRDGDWVDGPPRGYYGRDGRWVQANTDASSSGYYADKLWVPASASGYYAQEGRWIPAVSGFYDRSGQWISGPATGKYDRDGHWMEGLTAGHRDAKGAWIADPQPGYYEKGRWVRGETFGYYDTRGLWIATQGQDEQVDVSRHGQRGTFAAPTIDERQAHLAERIDRGARNGRLGRAQVSQARRTLASIERQERTLRDRHGQLGPRGRAVITARLDGLSESLSVDGRDKY